MQQSHRVSTERNGAALLPAWFPGRILASVRLLPNRDGDDDLLSQAQRQVEVAQAAADAAVAAAATADPLPPIRSELRPFDTGEHRLDQLYAREDRRDSSRTTSSAARAAALAAESAKAAEQAAFLLSVQVKLAKSTNTFRAWQQVPAWILGATGIALVFLLVTSDPGLNAGWVTVAVILVLAVVVSFRGPANIQFGSGDGGGQADAAGAAGRGQSQGHGQPDAAADQDSGPHPDLEPDRAQPAPAGYAARPRRPDGPERISLVPGGTRFLPTGRHFQTHVPLTPSLDGEDFANRLRSGLLDRSEEVRDITHGTAVGNTLRGERDRVRAVDQGDPRAAGWSFLVSRADPQADEIIDIVRPLAELRGMSDPGAPLIFDPEMAWAEWLTSAYQGLDPKDRPHYVLVLGSPQLVPFHFQALLDSTSATGRLAFDRLDDLDAYVSKIIRLEQAQQPSTRPEAVFFAPDGGPGDPTYFSRRYLAEPLYARMADQKIAARMLAGADATKANLRAALHGAAPALVYTASHGAGAPDEPSQVQREINGAICCQDETADWLFGAADVPADDEPFLEGAAFFQFACYGYGTPAESDFMHWLGEPGDITDADFVAALPTRLLRHPRGPVAFIGHVDVAWLHGFADPQDPKVSAAYGERRRPFQTAVDLLVNGNPAGLALDELNKRFDLLNGQLVDELDRLQRDTPAGQGAPALKLADTFIFRSDAQNHLLLGDPAARIRIAD